MDLRGRLDRSGDLQTSLRSSVGGRSSISELDTRDLQDFSPTTTSRPTRARGRPRGRRGRAAAATARPRPREAGRRRRRRARQLGGVATKRARADEGRRLVNGYELLGELGRGAFGTVELCERRGDLYAVKILRKSLLRKAPDGPGPGANALADARRRSPS
ncbi:hypothetical protein JL722_12180 [Aureococcus anophagefferens]|nr:hypothetical protein JL722_12180 [Aureococcus anophagefferens]